MKKFAALFVGLALMGSSVGCHCGAGGCYTPGYPGGAYYGGGYGGGCPTGNCGVAPGAYPPGVSPHGMLTPNVGTVQANYSAIHTQPIVQGAYAQPFGVTYPQTAFAPLEPLPTY